MSEYPRHLSDVKGSADADRDDAINNTKDL
jgi:hypothetical protein